MRALILSDIHANLEALEAVLAATTGQYDQLWNLGDIVGYGASPNQVCDLIRPLSTLVVRGNHDRVSCGLTQPTSFNPIARAAVLWTRQELTPENTAWLKQIAQGPVQPAEAEVSIAHGSPLDEDQYILNMRDAWTPLQQMPQPITFFGHTHVQGGFSQKDHDWQELRPQFAAGSSPNGSGKDEPRSCTLTLPAGTRHLINPGSVGQPRDRDWRAAYALYNSEEGDTPATLTFHRIPYDLKTSQQKILTANLPERLAQRLREGR